MYRSTAEVIKGFGKIYKARPARGSARKAWDELQAKANPNKLEQIYYDTNKRVWVGIHYKRMVSISYWPRIPGAIVD